MYESYIPMKPNDLHEHLTKKLKMHPKAANNVKKVVAQRKEALRTERITRTVYKRAWQDLLDPLRRELNNAKVGISYELGGTVPPLVAEQRIEAFTAYIAVMEKLLERFAFPSKVLDSIPTQIAKERNATKKGTFIPNNGLHWVDWVPSHIKNAIAQAFANLPHKPRAKRKVPFQRTVLQTQHERAKQTLTKRILTDQSKAERAYTINPSQENEYALAEVTQALEIIEQMLPNEPIPTTWRALLPMAEPFRPVKPITNPKENEDDHTNRTPDRGSTHPDAARHA